MTDRGWSPDEMAAYSIGRQHGFEVCIAFLRGRGYEEIESAARAFGRVVKLVGNSEDTEGDENI